LPRFAGFRGNEVNLRVGPGSQYPVEWTYQRRDLPVQIISEHQQWRRIRDNEGTIGWVHAATLTGRRTYIVKPTEIILRRQASQDSTPIARLRHGVIGRIKSCAAGVTWCEVHAGAYRGWVKRADIWGVTADEVVGD
jgi:SH3-like domain-containing protein